MLQELANTLSLDALLSALRPYDPKHVAHWQQGEFHHDYVLQLGRYPSQLPGSFLVVSTNCNGGVKELLCLSSPPERWGLWHARCPDNSEFTGEAPAVLASARTAHWFDPCEVLAGDAMSELRPEYRRRQRGGGWVRIDSDEE